MNSMVLSESINIQTYTPSVTAWREKYVDISCNLNVIMRKYHFSRTVPKYDRKIAKQR
jgi:hypothetical protein